MVSKNLFKTSRGRQLPATDTVNRAGGVAYSMEPEAALAQFAATCCFGGSYYTRPQDQISTVLGLAGDVSPEFLARTAVYSRTKAFMKDMPAVLLAALSNRDPRLMRLVAPRILDNGRMVRNFVQVIRSGVTGRKSLGTAPKAVVRNAIEQWGDRKLFNAAVGQDPSIADILKMVHPKPIHPAREALHAYLLGKEYNAEAIPQFVASFEEWKKAPTANTPDVEFRYLTGVDMPEDAWKNIARNAPWHMTRMNLNTFARHGVLQDPAYRMMIAERLKDPNQILRAKVFPYQILAAWASVDRQAIPQIIIEALHDAMEIATQNVPTIEGGVAVFPDVSASMGGSITGGYRRNPSSIRCVDVAALIASSLARTNPNTTVIPFDHRARTDIWIDPRDSVMTNATRISSRMGGATACSEAMKAANEQKVMAKLAIFVSDNESWVDSKSKTLRESYYGGTTLMTVWRAYQHRVPDAKLMCIDLVPNRTTQAPDSADVLNVGGFTDQVFVLMERFANGSPEKFREEIDKIEI